MKNTILRLVLTSVLLAIVIPAYAASVVQIWSCELEEGKTSEDAEAVSSAWLKAAKGMKGGDEMKVYLDYPIAAEVGGGSFNFVLVAPSFEAWGVLEDGYPDSPIAEADEAFAIVASCSGSSLWASIEMK